MYSRSMRARIIQVGNSHGLRIPKPLLDQTGVGAQVEIVAEGNALVVRPLAHPRAGWDEAFAAFSDDESPDLTDVSNKFDRDEWEW